MNAEKENFNLVQIENGEQLIQFAIQMKQYALENPVDMEVIAKKSREIAAQGQLQRVPELLRYTRGIQVHSKVIYITMTNDNGFTLQLSATCFEGLDQNLIKAIHEAFWSDDPQITKKQINETVHVWMKTLK